MKSVYCTISFFKVFCDIFSEDVKCMNHITDLTIVVVLVLAKTTGGQQKWPPVTARSSLLRSKPSF